MTFPFIVLTVMSLTPHLDCVSVLSLVRPEYYVREGDQVSVDVMKTGTAASPINVVLQIIDPSSNGGEDFIATSRAAVFPAGVEDLQRSLSFTTKDDSLPEKDERFIISLRVTNGDGIVDVQLSKAVLVIAANDDAFGVFGFVDTNTVHAIEMPHDDSLVSLKVQRRGGNFGEVVLQYQIFGEAGLVKSDIVPVFGNVSFFEGEWVKPLDVLVRADSEPEDNEQFQVVLTTVSGGDSVLPVSNRPSISVTDDSLMLVVRSNDAPVSFLQDLYVVDERQLTIVLEIPVNRGHVLQTDGTSGPIHTTASVTYYIQSISSATPNEDFKQTNGTIVFAPGSTQEVIRIDILPDTTPELSESFVVILEVTEGDIVLVDPFVVTVTISDNDDPNGIFSFKANSSSLQGVGGIGGVGDGAVHLDEDGGVLSVDIEVERRGGLYGEVSLDWELAVRSGSEDVLMTSDVKPQRGHLVFQDGLRVQRVTLKLDSDDNLPEPAHKYLMSLLPHTLQGGGRVDGLTSIDIIVEDSDEVHGVIQLTAEEGHTIITDTSPRKLALTFVRHGGTSGHVNVKYSVKYSGVQNNTEVFMDVLPTVTQFGPGQTSQVVYVDIRDDIFLRESSVFVATILEVTLVDNVEVGPFHSPSIGLRSNVEVSVSPDIANGEVGLAMNRDIYVEEPEDEALGSMEVLIPVRRIGFNGHVTVYWSVKGSGFTADHVTNTDIQPMAGSLTMVSGQSTANIVISVLPDDEAETTEEMTLTLTHVEPRDLQMLSPGQQQVTIFIQENDNPGGTFQLAADTPRHVVVQEELDPVDIHVIRTGGVLVTREVQLSIDSPNGDEEFYGATSVLKFYPGDTEKTVTLLARGDGIPELSEDFQLKLQGFGDSPVMLGSPSSVNITVLENEQPYGVFVFSNDSHMTGESKVNQTQEAVLVVQRSMGRFGSTTVEWTVTDQINASQDLYPLSGRLEFEPGEGEKYIVIETLPDEFPEDEEVFTVTLHNATGGATVGEHNSTRLTIAQNDDAIYFTGTSNVRVNEGNSVTFTIHRDGPVDSEVSVKVRTIDGSAIARGLDYITMEMEEVVFSMGEVEKSVTVVTLEDDIPETDELFFLELFDAQGDVSVYTSPRAIVTIAANDNANGVFSFSETATVRAEEGQQVHIEIQRTAGHFSSVYVHWEIYYNDSTQPLTAREEFMATEANVTFDDLQTVGYLELMAMEDEEPEFDEVFRVVLYSVSGGGPGDEMPSLAADNTQVLVVVPENDDPWGRFSFTEETREMSVAEDYVVGEEARASVSLVVERQQGMTGDVKVAWEVFSHQLAGGGNLPGFVSLLCVGEPGSEMMVMDPGVGRDQTQTVVYRFHGCPDCVVVVPSQYHPASSDIGDGFALSAWIKPQLQPGTAYIVAKTSSAGDREFYSLRLERSASGDGEWMTTLQFGYSTADTQEKQLVQSDVLGVELTENDWHHIVLNVHNGEASFYLDGQIIGLSALVTDSITDGPGQMYVGGVAAGTSLYTGYMQDVRIFTRKLNQGEISELYNTPSKLDLHLISGYLTFPDRVTTQNLVLTSLDDQEEEANEVFSVRLISASGGARVADQYNMAILTVLKSDNANGLFGFGGPCETDSTSSDVLENSTYKCPLQRMKGDAGEVKITWQVTNLTHFSSDISSSLGLADQDFVNATGSIQFLAGQREKFIFITILDDVLPELTEYFTVTLVTVVTGDGVEGSTPTSGGSIDRVTSQQNVTVPDSDQPYGLLQLMDYLPIKEHHHPTMGFVQPLDAPQKVTVREEQGVVILYVVRSQGVQGTVTLEWRTKELTARSYGKIPPDFIASVGELTFQPGEFFQQIEVPLVDNDIPEPGKDFEVELLNPGGGAEVGLGGIASVHIQHSDFAHGLFIFAENSLRVETTEPDDLLKSETKVAKFMVVREGGSLGTVSVSWSVSVDQSTGQQSFHTDPGVDIAITEGTIEFESGQLETVISLVIKDDIEPELDEVFLIELLNVSQGTLGEERTTATLIIEASDDPYGKFVISSSTQGPIYVEEGDKALAVTIMRSSTSGHYGTVLVDYATVHPSQLLPHIPGGQRRADFSDFNATEGSVIFEPGQSSANFTLFIYDDNIPEMDESIYVRLTGVQILDPQQQRTVENSPTLGQESSLYGEIIITENDDPHGVLHLTVAKVTVTEDYRGSLVNVIRSRGDFGSISGEIEVVQGTATSGLDYSVTVKEIHFSAGETLKDLPVSIIDDSLPELQETFTIRLLDEISGGARLGDLTETVVTIETSDDPYGAFVFERQDVTVREPASGERQTVAVSVVRLGGTLGVVTVDWTATTHNGGQIVDDITPSSGQLYFVSNEAHQYLTVDVVQDEYPEGEETILLHLTSASNGGRVIEDRSIFSLHITPNDNPHGTVEFSQEQYVVFEPQAESLQYVPVNRTGGTEGQLKVYYTVQETDLLYEALKSGQTLTDYFYKPKFGKPLPMAGTRLNVENQPNPLEACGEFCLLSEVCEAFDFHPVDLDCNWFSEGDYISLDNRTGYQFYGKDNSKTDALYTQQAKMLQDFTTTKEQTVVIPNGQPTGYIPVQVTPDTLPELPENFLIHLFHVELIGAPPTDPENLPQLGSQTDIYVTIAANDDANGVFRIYSKSPHALRGGQVVEVEERESFSVELIVERQGGGIGRVGVSWQVVPRSTTATRGTDFIADGATLSFQDGELYRAITVAVEDDVLPEDDETVVIELHSPTGGAELGQPDHNQATVVIMANDHVAGLLGFRKLSYLAKEGDHLTLQLWRSPPALGEITVTWEVQAVPGSDLPDKRFRNYAGTLYYNNGEVQKQILLNVLVDNEPKIDQEYRLVVTNIVTEGVRQTGAAGVDPVSGTATITIEGGNEPHGVFGFNSLERRASEIDGTVSIPVDRKFGSIGAVRIHYTIKHGSLRPVGTIVEAATPGVDFTAEMGHVTMYSGETSASIQVDIVEDEEPEIDEVFVVMMTSVELVTHGHSTYLPRIGTDNTAEVIIVANDGTQGEVIFPQQYANMTVSEDRQELALVVRRTKGTFGAVSVFCFAQNTKDGAVRGEDFNFDPMDIHFGPGVSEQLISVQILEDELPEPDEAFEIVLASPKQGLQVGDSGRALITILANDEASGIVSFDSPQNVTIVEPSSGSKAGSIAYITLVRAPGAFGIVRVPFTVESEDLGTVTDVTPTQGLVIFKDKQNTAVLELKAVSDEIPEEVELFTVVLGTPGGGSRLGPHSRKGLIIDRNDAPYGQLKMYRSGTRDSVTTIEEDQGVLYIDVVREQGSLGWVSVDLVTKGDSATHQQGPVLHTAHLHQLDVPPSSHRWYTFTAYERFYALVLDVHPGSDTTAHATIQRTSPLYRWQGTLVKSQDLVSDGVMTSACTFTINGMHYLFTTSLPGGQSDRTATSRLYRVQHQDAILILLQEISTDGASSSLFYTHNTDSYLMVHGLTGTLNQRSGLTRVYLWEPSTSRFSREPVQVIETNLVKDSQIVVIEDEKYLLVASFYDLKTLSYELSSVVYKLDTNGLWTIHQFIPTKGVVSLASFAASGQMYIVIGNNRDNAGDYKQPVQVCQWNKGVQTFKHIQSIITVDVQTVDIFLYQSNIYLTISAVGSTSGIYAWNSETFQFTLTLSHPHGYALHPLVVPGTDTHVKVNEAFLLSIQPSSPGDNDFIEGHIYQLYNMANESDYIPRYSRLSFVPGQTNLTVGLYINDDPVPEGPERFEVGLQNPRGGAELAQDNTLTVQILSSDEGHGIIEFAEDSYIQYIEELSTGHVTVMLSVVRRRGHSGHVVVSWQMSGEHNGNYDLSPQQGQVEFADGQSASTISLTVKDDGIPELDETSYVTLAEVLKSGSDRPDRGALIADTDIHVNEFPHVDEDFGGETGEQSIIKKGEEATKLSKLECLMASMAEREHSVARLIILSSDSPHGVVTWESLDHVTSEPMGTSSSRVALTLQRKQGTMGDIRVMYMTQKSEEVSPSSEAESGVDYIALQGSVDMAAGVTKATITIVILDDKEAELSESFLVNITSVQLFGEVSVTAVPPSISQPGRVATVTIRENDNARGVISFAVTRNAENRVDTYEGSPTLSLPVLRTVGYYGDVEVTWRAFPKEASLTDFTPSGGTVRFENGQKEAVIDITVVDDDIAELLETFELTLTQVTSGGATLGTDSVVKVGIVKNDSPTGVFSFIQSEVSVSESQYGSDPDGVASVEIHRQGADGEVTVHWRLDAKAVNDFLQPLAGSVRFAPGESRQTVSVRTKPDEILEGEERFNLSLVSVSNNADISPNRGYITLVILSDPGASGVVSVSRQSEVVYIGEPTAGSDGTVTIVIERGPGTFGSVDVTWIILQPDSSAFTQTQGISTIKDGETNGSVTIQTQDDSLAELRRSFSLVLTSATGGAGISEEYQRSRIIYTASDYPYGLFEFESASEILVNEQSNKVAITVRRRFGSHGNVLVTYTTDAASASDVTGHQDFLPSAGVLRFEDSVTEQEVFVQIVDDEKPEGPEHLFVNLTKVQLMSPFINATVVNGYQLDMPPHIGPVSSQKVVIIQNDNAEGLIQFAAEANNIVGFEDEGFVSVPIQRLQGYWGEVEVHFTVHNGTAVSDRDYIVSKYSILIRDGEVRALINITLVNDEEMEFEESFVVQLTAVTEGGTLGSERRATVIIAKSDYPNGKLSFLQPIRRELQNPESLVVIPVTVERSGGLLGRQMLKWRIMGPNNVNRLLTKTDDVSSHDLEGLEVTHGSLTWEDGEAGAKYFSLQIKPHSGWEVEETFVVVVYDVVCFPAEVGSAEMDPQAMTFRLSVLKSGDPNGVVRFSGVSQVHRQVQEPSVGDVKVIFPITRTAGLAGDIQVQWGVQSSDVSPHSPDIELTSGEVTLLTGQTEGEVTLHVLADDVPELDETFRLVLIGAEGGAEVDPVYNTSVFTVRYNDFPHGRFSVLSELQTVTVSPSNLHRQLRLNITRVAGSVGRVKVNFDMVYDQAKSGVTYVPATGSTIFNNSQTEAVTFINIEPQVFLAFYSTFTVTLTEVIYLDNDVTQKPEVIAESSVAKVTVPKMAANSQVGFEHSVVAVNESTDQVWVTIYRSGTYGTVRVRWRASISDVEEEGFSLGRMLPEMSTVTLSHGTERKTLYLQIYPDTTKTELFTLELSDTPLTSAGGGARLLPGKTVCRVEPHGVLGFVLESKEVMVEEPEQGTRQVALEVFRQYGSTGDIHFTYTTVASTAVSGVDFVDVQQGAVTMYSKQTSAMVYIQINSDSEAEVDEVFFVNITKVTSLSSQTLSELSPRISQMYGTAVVTIRSNSNPYGVVSIETVSKQPVSEPGSMELIVRRLGGSFGEIMVKVRSVGGGESWEQFVGTSPQDGRGDTIGKALGGRETTSKATAGQDYQVLDTTLLFKDGETVKTVTLYILDDSTPEGDETVYVYISPQTEGVGMAIPAVHTGRKGYTSVTILRNDFWSGWVGFYGDNSSLVTADEDSGTPVTFTVERRNATFGAVQLQWRAVLDKDRGLVTSPLLDLSQQLQSTSGVASCPALSALCSFSVHLRQDSVPENETYFWVELTGVSDGADIDPSRRFSQVKILPSDHPNGMVQFEEDSQYVLVNRETDHVTLNIRRRGYLEKMVNVRYQTMFLTDINEEKIVHGVLSSAIPHSDYEPTSGQLVFTPRQNLQAVRVELDLTKVSIGDYPKAFYVELSDITASAELGVRRAVVMIVDRDEMDLWQVWAMAQQQITTEQQLQGLVNQLLNVLSSPLNKEDLATVKTIVDKVLNILETLPLTEGIKQTLMDVLCSLLDPHHHLASLGEWQLSEYIETFARLYLRQEYPCLDCCIPVNDLLRSPQCQYVTFSVAKWPAASVNRYIYKGLNGDDLTLPDDIVEESETDDTPGGTLQQQQQCHEVVFVEYSAEHWFVLDRDEDEFLNKRIFTVIIDNHRKSGAIDKPVKFRVHAASSGVAVRKAECVYFDETNEEWTSGNGVCEVTNNLALALDDYVECSCKHLSNYAVRSRDREAGQQGYPLWFYICCTLSITALIIVILNHHLCSSTLAMFTVNLLMHFCFAVIATELCYLIDAYLSPSHILDISPDSSNYRCIIMSLVTNYFFLAQFTWMLVVALNFHGILILNDEHTRRKYVQFTLIGWGVPALIVFLFYVLTYIVYRFATSHDPDRIYGDVHSNGDICFVRNVYAGLAGVVFPSLVCLCVVGVIFLQAFQITPQWQAYDDIYKGRHNIHEVRLLLLFWSCILIQWILAGLHLAYPHLWILVIFCVFCLASGIIGLVVYAVIRNPCMPCSTPHKPDTDQSDSTDQHAPYKPGGDSNTTDSVISGSKASLISNHQNWQKHTLSKSGEIPVRRKPVSSVMDQGRYDVGGAYLVNPAPFPSLSPPISGSHSYSSHSSTVMSIQPTVDYTRAPSTDLDELIFALNTNSVRAPSDTSHQDTDIRGGYDFQVVREAAYLEGDGGNRTLNTSRQRNRSLSRDMDIVDTQL